MAIATADRDAVLDSLLRVFGEDFPTLGRLIGRLELDFPAVPWRTAFASRANVYAPFTASGLSKAWWIATVGRYADLYKSG